MMTSNRTSHEGGQWQEQSVTRESVLKLIKDRTSIDEQIDALGGILASNHVGMTEPVTDVEGFPRNDIDVYQVRFARQKIICKAKIRRNYLTLIYATSPKFSLAGLQNDRKNLTTEIEAKLAILHNNAKQNGEDAERMDTGLPDQASSNLSPIATVNFVADGSPAFQAGLRVNDKILSVGSIDSRNFTQLADIGSLVERSQGSVVNVSVNRDGTTLRLALIPAPWSGRGLIGCNIIPI